MDQHGRKLIQKRLADKSWYSPVHRFSKPGDQPVPKPWMTGQASYARAGFAPHQNPLSPSNPWNPSSSTLPPSSSQVSTGDGTGARRRSMRVMAAAADLVDKKLAPTMRATMRSRRVVRRRGTRSHRQWSVLQVVSMSRPVVYRWFPSGRPGGRSSLPWSPSDGGDKQVLQDLSGNGRCRHIVHLPVGSPHLIQLGADARPHITCLVICLGTDVPAADTTA